MTDKQGHNANKSGKWLETQVEDAINNIGIPSINFRTLGTMFGRKITKMETPGFLLKNVPYTNMYGGESRGEFVLQLNNKGAIRIECRAQNVAGSVDEKLPYLIGNCFSFKEKDVILVIEGDGMRKTALNFVKNAAKAIAHKNVSVLTLNQFRHWIKKYEEVSVDYQTNNCTS
jgi:hypothetical protein